MMNRSISFIAVLVLGSVAQAQQYRASSAGCTQLISSSPVSVSNCQVFDGCAGTYSVQSVGHAESATGRIIASYRTAIGSWMNFCGGGTGSGSGASWYLPVVFSGPTSTVQVQAQVDYEWTFQMSGSAPGGLDFRRCHVGVGVVGATQDGNPIGDVFGQYLSGPSAGTLIAPPVTLQTGVGYLIGIDISVDQRAAQPVSGVAVYDSVATARLPSVGPIFILPEGYTANSTVLGIVNNQFPPPPCEGDADGSGLVTFADITSVLANWGASYAPGTGFGDANHDGVVNFADVTGVLANFGGSCA